MVTGIVDTIKQVCLGVMKQKSLQILFGKVKSISPLTVNISNRLTLSEDVLVLNSPVDVDEEVIVIKYSTGNKYLVLSTVEKVYGSSIFLGGEITTGYSTSGKWKSLGKFTITHYCCEKYPHICNAGPPYKTATGTTPHIGGCAVDPRKIPLGSYIKINDVVYHAEDTGGAIKGNRIDLVVNTHKEALAKGKYQAEVFLKVGD